ncbi:MAG: hypothetical protein HYZ28_05300 [Myxococcales bacterium]|nr:hypothetical protein [Myxococcales bacterium]
MSLVLASCAQGPWWIRGNTLCVFDGEQIREYPIAPVPVGVAELYRFIGQAAPPWCRPPLLWLAHAGGAGGLYVPDLIAVGAREAVALSSEVRQARSGNAAESVLLSVLTMALAHELGHALLRERGGASGGVQGELRADTIAGIIAGRLGSDLDLDRVVMSTIGCNEVSWRCTHPRSEARVIAYEYGRTLSGGRQWTAVGFAAPSWAN